ncbi:DNA ligase 1 isoform X2 [Durio zibethinus]|uniref:DNA ligase 1 isoform X2 n=1 Tax=Durio zibethinus TaxID=66656 RepID=A0A6P6AEQ8_DURZI|nr:DNA ligase 1 isoform X2 [Durio zibethinus]
MKMVSDSDLVARLREILRDSDLDTATAGSVRRQLEEDFRVDLSDRKGFVRDQIDIFLETLNQENEREEQEPESENSHLQEEEEEESKGEGSQKTRRASKADKQVKKRGGGFQKVCSLSPQLQKVVGESELPRTEEVYIFLQFQLQLPQTGFHIELQFCFTNENVKHETKCEDSDDSVSVDAENAEEEEKEEERDEQMEEEEEEEDKEQEGNAHGSKQKRPSKVDKDVKRRGGGFTKLCSLSPQLQAFIGEPELARTEVVKRLWTYIREKNLQDPNNRRNILCDESLHALFRVNSINMFQMNKALSKHIWPLNEEDAHADSTKMERKSKQARERGANEPKQKEKKQKKAGSGFLAPLPLSDALVKFFGTGENALSRADVVKRMWEYIKQNDLQDPSDKRRILCDDKLKELFEVDSFNGFTIPKLLTTHFIKI